MASASPISKAAGRISSSVSRLDAATTTRLFPEAQRRQWPMGYIPASGVAHLLSPAGVPLGDVLECHRDIKHDGEHTLQRDFAADYTLWCRCTLSDFANKLDSRGQRRMKKMTARDRATHDADIRDLFQLQSYAPPPPSSSSQQQQRRTAPLQNSGVSTSSSPASSHQQPPPWQYYTPTPYAATQEFAMMQVSKARSPNELLHFTTFPQIHNVLYTNFDSMTALRGLSLYSGDALVLSTELIQGLALYLRRRMEELREQEPAFLRSGAASPLFNSSLPAPTFSRESPVVCFFTNGRLPYLLASTGLLPFPIHPVQLPAQAAQCKRRYDHLLSQKRSLEGAAVSSGSAAAGFLGNTSVCHDAITTIFPSEALTVGDALRKYKPAIALVEPHTDRDWIADIRGYCSVREVLMLGPVDSPAMGSFAFPFLSFGVTPGPTTYWTYNENLQRVTAAERIQMPMDPPHVSQGYERRYVDELSSYLISPNDCHAIGSQFRCLSFVRTVCPVVKEREKEQKDKTGGDTTAAASKV